MWVSWVNRVPFCQWHSAVEGEIMFGLVGIVVRKRYRLYVPGFWSWDHKSMRRRTIKLQTLYPVRLAGVAAKM